VKLRAKTASSGGVLRRRIEQRLGGELDTPTSSVHGAGLGDDDGEGRWRELGHAWELGLRPFIGTRLEVGLARKPRTTSGGVAVAATVSVAGGLRWDQMGFSGPAGWAWRDGSGLRAQPKRIG
jgi:hypothetical protein